MTSEMALRLKKASGLIYISLGLGVPILLLATIYDPEVRPDAKWFVGGLIGICLMSALAYQVGKGKNWAVWTYTILGVLGVLTIENVAKAFELNFLYGSICASQYVLQYFALFIIHEPKLKSSLGLANNSDSIQKAASSNNVIAFKMPPETLSKLHQSEGSSAISDLGKLHELFKAGAITQEEFQEQKKKMLDKVA